MWWDNRAKECNNYADFKCASTGEGLLWTGSSYCPKWLKPRLDCGRAQYRQGEEPRFQSARSSYLETKLTEKDGREPYRNFNEMQQQKTKPNISILLAALKESSSSRDLERGKKIHADAIESKNDSNIYVASTLVDMYAKCGSMVDARGVFDRMPHHDVVSWNTLMLGYAENGEGELALQLFARMQSEGRVPNRVTFLAALKACTSLAAFEDGKQVDGKLVKMGSLEKGMSIHSQAAKSGLESIIYVANTLIDMYAKCGSMVDAHGMFDRMPRHDVVTRTALMLGYAENGEGELALHLFACMGPGGCAPDSVTFLAALKACSLLAAKEEGNQIDGKLVKMVSLVKGMAIHSQGAQSGCVSDISVANTLVDMYAKCGSMVDARGVFDRIPHHNVVPWNALMLGYVENGEEELALQLFAHMRSKGCAPNARTFVAALKACTSLAAKEVGKQVDEKVVQMSLEKGMAIHSQAAKSGCDSDVFLASTLIDMYAKCGRMVDACGVFDRMLRQDVMSWNALMLGYAENGEGELALQLFACMLLKCCAPNARTFVAALKACTSLAAKEEGTPVDGKLVKMGSLEKGMLIHSQAVSCESDIFVANTLVDMYANCRSMADARRVFDRMLCHTVVSWNALMLGYAENGEGELALQQFARMRLEGCAPDARTFVSVLKACGSVAALEIGKTIHADICRCGLQNNAVVATCLVDFYGKCGSMVDAQQVFDSVATKDFVTWNALIAGYSHRGDTKHAFRLFDLFERMQKERVQANGITFQSILTACSRAGLVDKGKEYFQAMGSKYGINPGIEHYTCMVDILGRANQLDDVVAMVKTMPFKPNAVTWMAVLGACRKWKNVVVGRLAFESLLTLDEKQAAVYALMANIYGSVGMWEEKSKVQAMRRDAQAWKKPGQSWWTDQAGMVHTFVAGDTSHPQSEDIHVKLKHVLVRMKEQGYVADVGSVLHDISDDEKEDALCGHSERLAIACAMINTAPGTTIRIVKNLRVCDDCHKATSIISKIEQRHIICRDVSRFHDFKDGKCSCGDFW